MKIDKNRVVTIEYTLKDSEGEVLDTSEGDEPLVYIHGIGTLVPGLESRLVGSSVGATLSVDVNPDGGYGDRDEELVINMPKERFSEIEDLSVGMQLEATMSDGEQIITIKEIGADEVIVDANHPLAGMVLHFDIEVVAVREATAEELDHGHAHSDGHGHNHGHDHDHDHDHDHG